MKHQRMGGLGKVVELGILACRNHNSLCNRISCESYCKVFLMLFLNNLKHNYANSEFGLEIEPKIGKFQLDCSTSLDEASPNDCYIFHAFQTEKNFSKGAFVMGQYDNYTIDTLNIEKKSTDYCLFMALDSKRKTVQELREMNEQMDKQMEDFDDLTLEPTTKKKTLKNTNKKY